MQREMHWTVIFLIQRDGITGNDAAKERLQAELLCTYHANTYHG